MVSFLRSSKAGLKIRVGVYNDKRIDYFKGKSAVKALLSPEYAKLKNVPKVTSEEEAEKVLQSIIPFAFYLRVDRNAQPPQLPGQPAPPPPPPTTGPKRLVVNQMQMFKADEYYAWFWEGSQWTTYVGGFIMVAVILAGVMFPLWPTSIRIGASYVSWGVLLLIAGFFVMAFFRLIFYAITWIVASPGIWMFPNLFADVGFVDSFIPFWEWDVPKKKSKKGKKTDSSESSGKKSKKSSNSASPNTTSTLTSATPNSGDASSAASSRPQSRAATVEEVVDEDA